MAADPTVGRYKDDTYTKFPLALNRPGSERAMYIECIAWGRVGATIAEYYHKGSELYLSGELDLGSYTDREGVKRKSITLKIKEFSGGRRPTETTIPKPSPPRLAPQGRGFSPRDAQES